MSLAILVNWAEYIEARLTHDMIREKGGRPLLDYALVPCTQLSKNANPRIVRHFLQFNADLNELYQGKSLWICYILSLQDLDHCDKTSSIITIKTLIQHGIGRFIGITDLQFQPSNPEIKFLRVNTLQGILKRYQTCRPVGFVEDAYDFLDVLEAISRARHWAHAFQFETDDRKEMEKIWPDPLPQLNAAEARKPSRKMQGRGKRKG